MTEAWLRRWNTFWHEDLTTEGAFDFFRLYFYGSLIAIFLSNYYGRFFVDLAWADPALYQPTPLEPLFQFVPRTYESFTVILYTFLASCFVAAIGFLSPVSKTLAAVSGVFILNTLSSYGNWNHTLGPTALALVLLSWVPCSYRYSLDGVLLWGSRAKPDVWFFKFFQVVVVWSYFSSGLYKLAYSGLGWITSNSLHNYLIFSNFLEKQTTHEWLSSRLIEYPMLCWILGFATYMIELGSPIALFTNRLRYLVFALLVALQVTIYFSLKENFVMTVTILPTLFLTKKQSLPPERPGGRNKY